MKFILVTAILFIGSNCFSQTHPVLQFGVMSSNLNTTGFESKSRMGFHAGFSFYSFYSEKFQVISDFNFETGGAKTTGRVYEGNSFSNNPISLNQYVNTLSWALIGNYFFYKENIGIQFGPHFGLLNMANGGSSDIYYGTTTDVTQGITSLEVNQNLRKLNYGLTFGLSGAYQDFVLSFRYNMGLKSFNNADYSGQEQYTMKRNSIQVSVAYIFRNLELAFN